MVIYKFWFLKPLLYVCSLSNYFCVIREKLNAYAASVNYCSVVLVTI